MCNSTVVATLGQVMVEASNAERKGKIWSVPKLHGATDETLKWWRLIDESAGNRCCNPDARCA
jgi:hypothetical protein